MGAITTWDDLVARYANNCGEMRINKQVSFAQGRVYDSWVSGPLAGAAITTAAACTKATAGAMFGSESWQNSSGSTQLWMLGADFHGSSLGTHIFYDRLSHQGGLSGIVTTAQTTNLPTAALARYTTGEGVFIGLNIYTQIGATGTTVRASYTNSAATAGRTTPLVVFGGTGFREVNRLILLPLQAGDTGVRSVESVTVTATTGTAGAFGVTLFKPLMSVMAVTGTATVQDAVLSGMTGGGIPEILDDACINMINLVYGSNTAAEFGKLLISEA